jgi:hypothetical protein
MRYNNNITHSIWKSPKFSKIAFSGLNILRITQLKKGKNKVIKTPAKNANEKDCARI